MSIKSAHNEFVNLIYKADRNDFVLLDSTGGDEYEMLFADLFGKVVSDDIYFYEDENGYYKIDHAPEKLGKIVYGGSPADKIIAKKAKGVEICLISTADNEYMARVYSDDKNFFTDYEIGCVNLPLRITSTDINFYKAKNGKTYIDHSPKVLGLDKNYVKKNF